MNYHPYRESVNAASGPVPSRRRRGRLSILAGCLVLAIALAGGLFVYNAFESTVTDRSGPAMLKSIENLSRYEAAAGNFEVIVDLRKSGGGPLGFLTSDHVLLVAIGSVNAYVDFGNIAAGVIEVSPDRFTVGLKLPTPRLDRPNLDHDKSHVYNEDKGAVLALKDLFGDDNTMIDRAYQVGAENIGKAAEDAGLEKTAEENTRRMLTGMMTALGFRAVAVTFASSSN